MQNEENQVLRKLSPICHLRCGRALRRRYLAFVFAFEGSAQHSLVRSALTGSG